MQFHYYYDPEKPADKRQVNSLTILKLSEIIIINIIIKINRLDTVIFSD